MEGIIYRKLSPQCKSCINYLIFRSIFWFPVTTSAILMERLMKDFITFAFKNQHNQLKVFITIGTLKCNEQLKGFIDHFNSAGLNILTFISRFQSLSLTHVPRHSYGGYEFRWKAEFRNQELTVYKSYNKANFESNEIKRNTKRASMQN